MTPPSTSGIKRTRGVCPESKLIRNQFEFGADGSAKCKICQQVLKNSKTSNLKRHLETVDRENYEVIFQEPPPPPRRMQKIQIEMDNATYFSSCVKMTTVGGMPLNVFDCPGIQEIFSRVENGLGISHVNRNNITDKIAHVADQFRAFIRAELKHKRVCLKIDEATRRGRSVLGVNVQFLHGKKLIIRTLGLIDLEVAHTAENIKLEVLKLIAMYDLSLGQIYTVTTDNGANFVKAVELLKQEIARYKQVRSVSSDDESDNEELEGEVEEDIDENYSDDDGQNSIEAADNDEEEDEIDKVRVLLGGVRCAAHTLQLTVHDCIKECRLKKHLINVRSAVKVLKKFPFKASFKLEKLKLPFLDCETRWNSAFEMVSYFKENETFLKDLLKSNQKEALISKATWTFISNFTAVFQPVYIATKRLQEENMTIGDFLFAWETCRLELEDSTSSMAKCLIRHMDRRRVKLFSAPIVAALYLDPRVNFRGSEFLTEDDRKAAVDHLLELWNTLKDDQRDKVIAPQQEKVTTKTTATCSSSQTSQPSTTNQSSISCQSSMSCQPSTSSQPSISSQPSMSSPPSKMELFLRRKAPTKSPECSNIEQKLHELSLQPRVCCDDDVLEYWECMKNREPELYALAQVALAVPCTQVSVERSFNSLALILSDRRLRLGSDNLTNILLVKLNAVLFELLDLKF